ncbi:MAG: YabP/YqfC family sporulation protein [Acutalibacteraceae bacterium]
MDKKRMEKLASIGDDFVSSSALPHTELDGTDQALVEGCKGIVEYNGCIVKINCGHVTVKFCGCDLSIKALSAGRISVSGKISCVEFE